MKDYFYFIGKGIITDENYNPLVLVTFDNVSDKYDFDRGRSILKMEYVDVYYNRVIFSEDFIKINPSCLIISQKDNALFHGIL